MSILTHIKKRNNTLEPINYDKLNKWVLYAEGDISDVSYSNWQGIVADTLNRISRTSEISIDDTDKDNPKYYITSRDLQQELINTYNNTKLDCDSIKSGRLYMSLISKDVNNDIYNNPVSIKDIHQSLLQDGLLSNAFVDSYNDDDYKYIDTLLNSEYTTELENDLRYYQIVQLMSKYALSTIELPRYIYMRLAMALSQHLTSNRHGHLKNFYYLYLSGRLNAPTPFFTNAGTHRSNYNSCCVYTTKDNVKSLATGDHIAYTMTYSSAGIGSNIQCRSINDEVKGGAFTHQGKLPYYRSVVYSTLANTQQGRGGAITITYYCYDPEIETIHVLKNPMTPSAKQIRNADYSLAFNRYFVECVAQNKQIALFSMKDAPEVYEVIHDDEQFIIRYNKMIEEKRYKKLINARDILLMVLKEAVNTGRHYYINLSEMNKHTPFKDAIIQSNLCLHGDTKVTIKVDGVKQITTLEHLNQLFNSGKYKIEIRTCDKHGNILWKPVTNSACMGVTNELYEIEFNGKKIQCTADHKIITFNRGKVMARDLKENDILITVNSTVKSKLLKINKVKLKEPTPVYDITVDELHTFLANDILVSNCQEIALPTRGFNDVTELYNQPTADSGEIGLCSLGGIVISKIKDDAEYYKCAYYALLAIRHAILHSEYVFPHLKETAISRMSAGVGILGLAHYLAQRNLNYTSHDSLNAIHRVAERHYYMLLKASLALSKEYGKCAYMNKTKWVDGWLPIDTYNKNVDSITTEPLLYDWETLRQDIIDNKGIHNSVLVAHMPAESSSLSSGTTNGIYPIRRLSLTKNNNNYAIPYTVPQNETLSDKYTIAYDINPVDLKKVYAVIQKFTDQAISADEFVRIVNGRKLTTKELLTNFMTDVRYGNKSRYYLNQETSTVNIDTTISNSDCCSL